MQKGFTLIEILVVLGILALLVSFTVPYLMGIRDKAKEAAVKSVMHSVQLAIEAYHMENNVYPMAQNTTLRRLCEDYLMVGGFLATVPKNPFTNQEYKESDVAGKIMYNYNDINATYTLTGYKRNGTSKLLELTNM